MLCAKKPESEIGREQDSNPRHALYKSAALPTELSRQLSVFLLHPCVVPNAFTQEIYLLVPGFVKGHKAGITNIRGISGDFLIDPDVDVLATFGLGAMDGEQVLCVRPEALAPRFGKGFLGSTSLAHFVIRGVCLDSHAFAAPREKQSRAPARQDRSERNFKFTPPVRHGGNSVLLFSENNNCTQSKGMV